MIKKIIVMCLLACAALADNNFVTTVTNVSSRIAAKGNSQAVVLAVGNTVTNGTLYYYGSNVYMAVGSGVTTNNPVHTSGDVGSPVLRWYPASATRITQKRTVIFLDNLGTVDDDCWDC